MIEQVRQHFPELKMVTFKYEENISHEELMEIAKNRLSEKGGSQLVVANRVEEFKQDGTQVARLLESKQEPQKHIGKKDIASAILDRIELTA